MGKTNSLKESMKGGLNGLLSPTTKPQVTPKNSDRSVHETQEKETPVHCNFVINKSIHTRMKFLAIKKNMSLKDIVNEAMKEYLEKYE